MYIRYSDIHIILHYSEPELRPLNKHKRYDCYGVQSMTNPKLKLK